MVGKSAKVVIFRSESSAVDLVLNVENYDEQFSPVAYAVIEQWHSTTEEYTAFLLTGLRNAGYVVTLSNYTELSSF